MTCLLTILKILAGILLSAGALHLAALMTGHGNRGFGAAVACSISVYILWFVVVFYSTIAGCFSPCLALIGFAVGIWLNIKIIESVYETSIGYAFLMWLIPYIIALLCTLLIYGPRILSILTHSGHG